MPTTLLLGNTAPLEEGARVEHLSNAITVVQMRDGFDDAAEAELALSTRNDPVLSLIGRHLSAGDRHYAIGVAEVESLWTGIHSADPPEWAESDDEDFARVVAAHFTDANHECQVGRPDGWQEG